MAGLLGMGLGARVYYCRWSMGCGLRACPWLGRACCRVRSVSAVVSLSVCLSLSLFSLSLSFFLSLSLSSLSLSFLSLSLSLSLSLLALVYTSMLAVCVWCVVGCDFPRAILSIYQPP